MHFNRYFSGDGAEGVPGKQTLNQRCEQHAWEDVLLNLHLRRETEPREKLSHVRSPAKALATPQGAPKPGLHASVLSFQSLDVGWVWKRA